MRILILGGTGAMGTPLVKMLSENGNEIYVTSRSKRLNQGNIYYLQGNAHDIYFFKRVLSLYTYDAIVDFMVYSTTELEYRLPFFLNNTEQYVFLSSSRVYAEYDGKITEESPRLLDICIDKKYLSTNEYALSKAREENLLFSSNKKNWTIIRPYITYNSQRLQLGVYEKEDWLYRALQGRTIVFPKDIANKITTLTYGEDVAKGILHLIGNSKAYGQAFNIVTSETAKWGEILNLYMDGIERKLGIRPKVLLVENSHGLSKIWNSAQIKYDRLYDRKFDNSKIKDICKELDFLPLKIGIEKCLNRFMESYEWLDVNPRLEGWSDRIVKERTPFREWSGINNKFRYLKGWLSL